MYNALDHGQLQLVANRPLVPNGRYAQLGDGTYSASIRLYVPKDLQAWGELALTNDGPFEDYTAGGYLVFVRANGNLGVYKAGVGQVVPDIVTGTDPVAVPVRLRVVKAGPNLQVYINGSRDPLVNWTDTGAPAWGLGSFSLVNGFGTGIAFTDVTYAGNDAR